MNAKKENNLSNYERHKRYLEKNNLSSLHIVLDQKKKDYYMEAAKRLGMSLTEFACVAMEEKIRNDSILSKKDAPG